MVYVHGIVADPEKQRVAIALYPAAFNQKIGVTDDFAIKSLRSAYFVYRGKAV